VTAAVRHECQSYPCAECGQRRSAILSEARAAIPPTEADVALQLARETLKGALRFPGEIDALRQVVGELMFEVAALRWQHEQLAGRVEALERRAEVNR
jgi:hypothetical protein